MLGKVRIGKCAVLLILTLALMVGCSKEVSKRSPEGEAPEPGEEPTVKPDQWGDAPDFTLTDLKGSQFTLSSLGGKVIVLNFWGSWCPPCRREIPDFISFYNEYGDKGVEIVGVALERDGGVALRTFVKKNDINYTVVLGNQEVTRQYGGIQSVPTTFIIDRSGNIRQKHIGAIKKKTLEDDVRPLL